MTRLQVFLSVFALYSSVHQAVGFLKDFTRKVGGQSPPSCFLLNQGNKNLLPRKNIFLKSFEQSDFDKIQVPGSDILISKKKVIKRKVIKRPQEQSKSTDKLKKGVEATSRPQPSSVLAEEYNVIAKTGSALVFIFCFYKFVDNFLNKIEILTQQYGMEVVMYDDNFEAIEACTSLYKKKIGPFLYREQMFKEFVVNHLLEKAVTSGSILTFQFVCTLFGFKEKKLVLLAVEAALKQYSGNKSVLLTLYILMDRSFKTSEGREALQIFQGQLAEEYGTEDLTSTVQTIVEAAYHGKVSDLGNLILETEEKPNDWEPLGLSEDVANQIFESAVRVERKLQTMLEERDKPKTQAAEFNATQILDAPGSLKWSGYYTLPADDLQNNGTRKIEPYIKEYDNMITPLIKDENADSDDEEESTEMEASSSSDSVSRKQQSSSGSDSVDLLAEVGSPAVQKMPNTYECSSCGYTLFIAQGRDEMFFGEGYECPNCGASKDKFKKIERTL